MTFSFASYSNISVSALSVNPKNQDIINKKQEILSSISHHYGSTPISVLFVGFSPLILCADYRQIYVTAINAETKKYLDDLSIKYTYIEFDNLVNYKKQFNWVIASDEYFTFANTEEEQRGKVETLANLTKDLMITTLRDYKNQDFKDREFSHPLAVHNQQAHKIFVEYHNYDFNDKNSWNTSVYELLDQTSHMHGPFPRRSMFFKQLAKFSIDAGAKNFYVHKNLMYKSLIKKNYEHVITISF